MTKRKALLHIGGSRLQLPSLQWARELGLYVVLTDRNPEAPGAVMANRFEVIDGTDVDSLLALAHEVAGEYDLVGTYASSDFGLRAVAAIAEALGRPSCSRLAVERALDKAVAKDIWRREGVPTPKGMIVKDHKSLFSAVDEVGLPVIFKPTNSSGSQGVRSVWDAKDLEQTYTAARRFSDSVLVEQLVSGHHIDVNGLFVDGEFLSCGTMDRFFSEPPYHYPVWGCQPSSLDPVQKDVNYKLIERAARALGLEVGPVKGDIIWTDSGPVILELSPRFHGDVITAYVTPRSSGCNPIKAYLAYLSGLDEPYRYLAATKNCFAGWHALFPSVQGVLLNVSGIDAAMSIPGIYDAFLSVQPGSKIEHHVDNSSVCGFVWAEGAEAKEVRAALDAANSRFRFEVV